MVKWKKSNDVSDDLAKLRAKGLLAKGGGARPVCPELAMQITSAEFCAALSQSMVALSAKKMRTAPRKAAKAHKATAKADHNNDATVKMTTKKDSRLLARRAARAVAAPAVTLPVLADLSAHYGSHANRRGGAKPLGPAFRSRRCLALGTHEGRAWRIWGRAAMGRRWCRRCGIYLVSGITAIQVAVPAVATAMMRTPAQGSSSSRVGKSAASPGRKAVRGTSSSGTAATAAAEKYRRVCRRCFTTEAKRCVRFHRAAEEQQASLRSAAEFAVANSSGTGITSVASAARELQFIISGSGNSKRTLRGAALETVKDAGCGQGTAPPPPQMILQALARRCAVKRTCRRKRRLTGAKLTAHRLRQAKRRRAVATGAATGAERLRVVKNVLLQAVPKGPIRRPVAAAAAATPSPSLKAHSKVSSAAAVTPSRPAKPLAAAAARPSPLSPPPLPQVPQARAAPPAPSVAKKSAAPVSAAPPSAVAAKTKLPPVGPPRKLPPPSKAPASSGKKKVTDLMNKLGF